MPLHVSASCKIFYRFTNRWYVSLSEEEYTPARGAEVSGPAIHYFLQLQHSFEEMHTRVHCRNMIDEYVNHHDGGLTVDVMRAACDLPPRKRGPKEPSTLAAITAADSPEKGTTLRRVFDRI